MQLILMIYCFLRQILRLEGLIVALKQTFLSFVLWSAQVSLEHSMTSVHTTNYFFAELPDVRIGRLESPDLLVQALYARNLPGFLQIEAYHSV